MPRSTSVKSPTARAAERTGSPDREKQHQSPAPVPGADLIALQRSAGNASVSELLRKAGRETGQPLTENVRRPLEEHLGVDLRGVRVHGGSASGAAAEQLDARAYTVGSDIHLGSEARALSAAEQHQLLAHEAVHTVQQGGRPARLQNRMRVSHPADSAEIEARQVANAVMSDRTASPSLQLRASMRSTSRVTPVATGIQRDIKANKTLGTGKFEVNFKKNEGAAKGDQATEDGTVKFTPSKTAPESDSIRFVQIVRTIDTTGVTAAKGADVDWGKVGGGGEAPRNLQLTKRDTAKNIAPGFFVDQLAAALAKRTKKADPEVLPYYDAMLANPGNKIGKRKGKTIVPAVLDDHPGFNIPVAFNFVTSAKAADTGTWYGTVLWGFETFLDKKGVAKIKNEYSSFRAIRGETTDEALKRFDEFYRNPGASTAPKK